MELVNRILFFYLSINNIYKADAGFVKDKFFTLPPPQPESSGSTGTPDPNAYKGPNIIIPPRPITTTPSTTPDTTLNFAQDLLYSALNINLGGVPVEPAAKAIFTLPVVSPLLFDKNGLLHVANPYSANDLKKPPRPNNPNQPGPNIPKPPGPNIPTQQGAGPPNQPGQNNPPLPSLIPSLPGVSNPVG